MPNHRGLLAALFLPTALLSSVQAQDAFFLTLDAGVHGGLDEAGVPVGTGVQVTVKSKHSEPFVRDVPSQD